MNQKRKKYFFLNYQGECLLPNKEEVKISDFNNQPYILIPDNNVCIHVYQLNIDTQDNGKIAKAEDFLKYVSESNITVNPGWGLLERASKPGYLNLDIAKLEKFEDTFWKKLKIYHNTKIISQYTKSIGGLKTALYPIYAYLLKIKLILVTRTPSAKNAQQNIEDFYQFAEDIKFSIPSVWQIALAIFGGNTQASKLIKPEAKDIFKALWGASWDIFYLQLPHLFYGVRETNNSYPQCIFVTDDQACAMIGSLMKINMAVDFGKVTYNHTSLNLNFPHLQRFDSFLFEKIHNFNCHTNKRIVKREFANETERISEIKSIIDKSEEYISQFTYQLNKITSKGFGYK